MRNCAAITIDHHFSCEAKGGVIKKFQNTPNITKDDYDFIRTLSNWNGGPINMYTPFIILVDRLGHTVPAAGVIENLFSSFCFILPQTIIYCTLHDMKEHGRIAAQTQAYELSSQPTICNTNSQATSLNDWHHVLLGLHCNDKLELKRRLGKKHDEHTLLPKPGETTMEYIQRHGQRIPLEKHKKGKHVS